MKGGREALAAGLQVLFFVLFLRPFLALFIGLRVRGSEHLPARGPFVLIANHSSHLDTASLLSLFPLRRLREVRPVAAADYFERNAAVAWLSRTLFNILAIPRREISADNDPIARMVAALDRGESLILFPEGTRASGEEIGPFKSGVARIAMQRPGVAIVPAYLANMGRALPKGQFVPLPLFCEIRLGPALRPSGTRDEVVAQLATAVAALKDAE